MEQIHGHEVMQMIFGSNKALTREALIEEIVQHFGEDTRFYNCSADNMTAKDIVAFFESKGKFICTDNGIVPNLSGSCNH
jgi:probable metal-binding protein